MQITPNSLIKAVVDYVRNMQSVDDLNAVAWKVFGANSTEKINKFKQCVAYYNKNNKTQFSKSSGKNSRFKKIHCNKKFYTKLANLG